MLHRCVTTLMANGPGFGFSWVKCNMVLSDAKYTDIGVPLFFVPRIYVCVCVNALPNNEIILNTLKNNTLCIIKHSCIHSCFTL